VNSGTYFIRPHKSINRFLWARWCAPLLHVLGESLCYYILTSMRLLTLVVSFSSNRSTILNTRSHTLSSCLPFTSNVRLALLHTATAILGAHILNCLVLKHPFHIVSPSPWPILASASSLLLVFGLVQLVAVQRFFVLGLGLGLLALVSGLWFYSIVAESTYSGHHTCRVQRGLRLGFLLFIISEVFFFLSFFWAYLHIGSSPAVEIGSLWPPKGIRPVSPFGLPLLNTVLLLSSAVSLTRSHHYLLSAEYSPRFAALSHTVILGLYFLEVQAWEFFACPFTMSDSVFGSCFFLLTGFHGIHVLLGLSFLLVNLYRLLASHFSPRRHLGFEFAI